MSDLQPEKDALARDDAKVDTSNSPSIAAAKDETVVENGSGVNEKQLLRKLDLTLLPPLTLLYLLSFLDRSNSTC